MKKIIWGLMFSSFILAGCWQNNLNENRSDKPIETSTDRIDTATENVAVSDTSGTGNRLPVWFMQNLHVAMDNARKQQCYGGCKITMSGHYINSNITVNTTR